MNGEYLGIATRPKKTTKKILNRVGTKSTHQTHSRISTFQSAHRFMTIIEMSQLLERAGTGGWIMVVWAIDRPRDVLARS